MIFLKQFFLNLNLYNISYCVLRNYSNLPYSTAGSDLDILIKKEQLPEFWEVLSETVTVNKGSVVSIIKSKNCPKICLIGKVNKPWGLMIDLYIDAIIYRGQTIITEDVIQTNTISYNNIHVLDKPADSYVTLLKELLNNKTCSEKHYKAFVEHSLNDEFLDSVFKPLCKSNTAEALKKCNPGGYNEAEVKRLVKELSADFPNKWYNLLYKAPKLSRFFRRPGYSIAFIGSDGSGKSTLIDMLTPVLNETFHKAVYYKHLRPGWLSPLARLSGKKAAQSGPVTDPHASLPSGYLVSLIRWSYYLMDYVFGYYLKVFPKQSTKACVFIFDRYYYDYYIDQRRSRINLPAWVIRLGQIFIPEPDIILCLGTEPEIIHSRKPELPLPEVERQVIVLRKFCKNHRRAIWIDTGKSIEESADDTLKAIIGVMARRFESVMLR